LRGSRLKKFLAVNRLTNISFRTKLIFSIVVQKNKQISVGHLRWETWVQQEILRVAVVVGSYPPVEAARRADMIRRYSTSTVDVDVITITPSPYVNGFTGKEAVSTIPAFVEGFREAEAAGYDAVLPLGVLDIGIDEGRKAVNIPVVGAYEAAIHMAALMGRRLGVITYNAGLLPTLEALTAKYGLAALISGYDHVGFELPDFAAKSDQLEDGFCDAAARLIQQGANVIVSAGISLCPVHLDRDRLQKRMGLPVVEALGAPIAIAAMLARLRSGSPRKSAI
jgi:allantoin racemase